MSAMSVLQTPPSSPQRFEEDDTTSSGSHQKTNDVQQGKIEAPETLPPTPRYECDDVELHATENGTSTTNDAADHQADPPLERTEELKALHGDTEVGGLEVSLTPPSTPPTHEGKEDKTEDVVSAVGTGKAQDKRTITKENEDDPFSTGVIADHTTPAEDTKASLSSESFEHSEKDEQKETDHVTTAVETTDSSYEELEQVEGAKVEIPPSKAEAKEPPVLSPAKVTQSILSTSVQQQPVQQIRVITPGYESARFRCQGTTVHGKQCKLRMNCRHHLASNRKVLLETALAGHPQYLCRGVTKAMTLCKNPAQSCGHPEHRGERGITKGDVFREHLSTHIRTLANKKLYFITERDANIELVKGWPAGPVGPNFRHQLVSQDLYPTNARPEVRTKIRACIDSFVQKAEEITSSYEKYIRQSIFHAIHEHLIDLKSAKCFLRDDEKTLRPFATGYVYFVIYIPGSFLYYDEDCENQVEALHDVVDHLVREIKIEDWIQALYTLKPLQEFFKELVV
ncbi:hypothetical protein BGZ59_010400 [Podila verticillata]|nr:hypothetical protein BGZ59_010400 [Podila verticillata]